MAQYAVVDRGSVVVIDKDLPLADAALFGCAVMTGVGAVVNTARIRAGDSVAIIGLGRVVLYGPVRGGRSRQCGRNRQGLAAGGCGAVRLRRHDRRGRRGEYGAYPRGRLGCDHWSGQGCPVWPSTRWSIAAVWS